MIKTA